MSKAYADAAPLHGACGMKHYAVDECDPTARVARRCPLAKQGDCKSSSRFTTKSAYESHLKNKHGFFAADLVEIYIR